MRGRATRFVCYLALQIASLGLGGKAACQPSVICRLLALRHAACSQSRATRDFASLSHSPCMTQASRRRSPIQLCGVNQVTIIKFWRLLLPCAKVRGRVALRAKLRDAFHTELRAKLRDASWVWLNTASAVTFVAGRVVVGRLIVYCCPATMRTPRAQVTAWAVVLLVCGARRVILLIIPLRAFAFRGARCLLAAGLRSAPTTNVVSLQRTLYH